MPKKYKISSRPQGNGRYKLTYLRDMVRHSAIKATNYFDVYSHRNLSQLGSCYCYNLRTPGEQRGMAFGDSVGLNQGKIILRDKAYIFGKATVFPVKLFRFARS